MMSIKPSKLREMLKRHEGLRLKPYLCPSGKYTIGYGRNLEDNGITLMEANIMLSEDISRVLQECTNAFVWFNAISIERQDVVADMAYNLGMTRLLKFKKFLSAMSAQDYVRAAQEMLDSRYAQQVPMRARELARMMVTGSYGDQLS